MTATLKLLIPFAAPLSNSFLSVQVHVHAPEPETCSFRTRPSAKLAEGFCEVASTLRTMASEPCCSRDVGKRTSLTSSPQIFHEDILSLLKQFVGLLNLLTPFPQLKHTEVKLLLCHNLIGQDHSVTVMPCHCLLPKSESKSVQAGLLLTALFGWLAGRGAGCALQCSSGLLKHARRGNQDVNTLCVSLPSWVLRRPSVLPASSLHCGGKGFHSGTHLGKNMF